MPEGQRSSSQANRGDVFIAASPDENIPYYRDKLLALYVREVQGFFAQGGAGDGGSTKEGQEAKAEMNSSPLILLLTFML